MAENIYSKGTRVWFEDKDQAWISAEVITVTKGASDTIKLVFLDERGKVSMKRPLSNNFSLK
jgi:myosin V